MKDLIIFLAALAAGVVVWKLLSKKLYALGHAAWKVRLASLTVAFVSFILTIGLLAPTPPTQTSSATVVKAKEKPAQTAQAPIQTPEPPKPVPTVENSPEAIKEQIKKLKPEIQEVSLTTESVLITHLRKPVWDGKHWVSSFFFDTLDIIKAFPQIAGTDKLRTITFLVRTPTVDQMGKEGDQLGMKVTYELPPFKAANWNNMSAWNMANLPKDIEFKRLGLESAVEYCKDEDNAKNANTFCRRVLIKLQS
ncbi:hypothetical protein [Gulbenkiania mobilis]|uniref:hypothetical protein n=1 Tax=Gulbenkiania mobilis TaxID=397457 RepID=UPI0006BBBE45|nr:hypothetical protein [Gulbenkiania mobilis]